MDDFTGSFLDDFYVEYSSDENDFDNVNSHCSWFQDDEVCDNDEFYYSDEDEEKYFDYRDGDEFEEEYWSKGQSVSSSLRNSSVSKNKSPKTNFSRNRRVKYLESRKYNKNKRLSEKERDIESLQKRDLNLSETFPQKIHVVNFVYHESYYAFTRYAEIFDVEFDYWDYSCWSYNTPTTNFYSSEDEEYFDWDGDCHAIYNRPLSIYHSDILDGKFVFPEYWDKPLIEIYMPFEEEI